MMMRDLNLPPGFRFHPTDEELVVHYLCRKCSSQPIAVPIVAEIDLYQYDPWSLPGMAAYGEKEWYFFSHRDRKYPNGSRPNRAAGSGYWKATGADKPIRPGGNGKPLGIKKALVFYCGKAPKGEKTDWIMHEYRLAGVDRSAHARHRNSLRLDDWVLCRIYNKKGAATEEGSKDGCSSSLMDCREPKTQIAATIPQYGLPHQAAPPPAFLDLHHLDSPESMPRLQPTDSSCCSTHVISSDFKCEREVQSEPRWPGRQWQSPVDVSGSFIDAVKTDADPFLSQLDGVQLSPVFGDPPYQDIFSFLHKPF